ILELLIYPVIYVIWRKRELKDQSEEEAPFLPPPLVPSERMKRRLAKTVALIVAIVALFYTGNFAWQKLRAPKISAAPFVSQTIDDLTVNFIHPQGQLRQGNNEILIEFRNAQGQLVDVGNVKFELNMNMPGMQMHSGGTIKRTKMPGQYRAKIKIDMAGDWNAKLSFEGRHGSGQQSFSVTVK
ncbi:MAG: FixH family protein, partial [Candidatus Udaeobacter sp.]